MLKRELRGLALALALCLCAAGVYGLSAALPAKTAPAQAEAQTAQADYTMLYTLPAQDFSAMEATVLGECFTVDSDLVYDESGNLLGVRNSYRQPILLRGQEDFLFDPYAYQMLLLISQNLPVTQKARADVTALAPFGLDEPAMRFTVQEKGGATLTLLVGDQTPGGDGCYVMLEGARDVYVAPPDLYTTFAGGLRGLHRLPTALGFTAADVTQLQIDRAGEDRVTVLRKDEAAQAASVLPFQLALPFVHDVNTQRLEEVLDGLAAALPDAYAGRWTTEEDKARYGLNTPVVRFAFATSDGQVMELCVGADAEGAMAYATWDRSGIVYLIDKEKLAFCDKATADYLAERYISLVNVSALSGLELETAAGTRIAALSWGDDAAVPETYLMDGAPVAREAFTAFYKQLVGIRLDKIDAQAAKGALKLRVRFQLRTAGEAPEVCYYACNDDYDSVWVDGEARFLVRREKVDALVAAAEALGRDQ